MLIRVLLAVGVLLGGLAASRGWAQAQTATKAETEAKDLVAKAAGTLLIKENGGLDIAVVTLPSLKKQAVTLASAEVRKDEFPYIYALAGPDEEGRIAYIEDYFFVPRDSDRRHLLKTVKLDGTGVQTLFTRPKDAMWNSVIGRESLALAPVGGRIALLGKMDRMQ